MVLLILSPSDHDCKTGHPPEGGGRRLSPPGKDEGIGWGSKPLLWSPLRSECNLSSMCCVSISLPTLRPWRLCQQKDRWRDGRTRSEGGSRWVVTEHKMIVSVHDDGGDYNYHYEIIHVITASRASHPDRSLVTSRAADRNEAIP